MSDRPEPDAPSPLSRKPVEVALLMAGQGSEGFGGLLLVGGLVLALIYWKIVLSLLLVVGIGAGLITLAQALRVARLRSIAKAAQRRFAGDVCRIDERFALVEAIDSEANARQARLLLHSATIEPRNGQLALVRDVHRLTPPVDLRGIASNLGFADFLQGQGITMVNDLAVEAKATQAAITCLREAEWASQSLQTMAEMIASTRDTLAKARGNELLEPAIPQLEEALGTFTQEEDKLTSHLQDSLRMLGKLHDFLGVPQKLRPILNFDLDGLFDPARRSDLEASFQEVVSLNQAFGELSRDRLI
ncbi:MAG: hypothetical protein NTW51_14850 [Cyanobacteria bacterium]|nr:hypothetical protein [Cyanobacteriota bacterium]